MLGLDGMGLGEYCPDGALALCRALEANTSLQHLLLEVSQPEPCSPSSPRPTSRLTHPGPYPNPIPSPNPNRNPNPDPNPNASPSPSPNPNPEQGNQLGAAPPALGRALARNDAVLRLLQPGGAAAAAAAAARCRGDLATATAAAATVAASPVPRRLPPARPRALGRLQVGPRPETDPAVLFAAEAEVEGTAERSAEVALRAEAAEEEPAGLAQGRPSRSGSSSGAAATRTSVASARLLAAAAQPLSGPSRALALPQPGAPGRVLARPPRGRCQLERVPGSARGGPRRRAATGAERSLC